MLEQTNDKPQTSRALLYSAVLLMLVCVGGAGSLWLWKKSPAQQSQAVANWHVPEEITPFSVLTLLKNIERNNGLSPQSKSDLTHSIRQIERYYFADNRESAAPIWWQKREHGSAKPASRALAAGQSKSTFTPSNGDTGAQNEA